jgi:hypothetical protein
VRELKEMDAKLVELGINSGALLKLEQGKPHTEGKTELDIYLVKILQESDTLIKQPKDKKQVGSDQLKEERLFSKIPLGKITVDGDITVNNFKNRVFDELIKDKDLGV